MRMFFNNEVALLAAGLVSGGPAVLMGIVSYLLTALAVYTISRRRGLGKPWLAWIPVVNVWLLGSLSDQYQYVVKRQNRSRRVILLTLSILMGVLSAVCLTCGILLLVKIGLGIRPDAILGLGFAVIGCALPLAGCAIAYAVIRYMALYDVFRSLDPGNATLFLVLSIFMGVTEPFFLFFSRDKDDGMPPRRPEPAYEQPQYAWEEETGRDPL